MHLIPIICIEFTKKVHENGKNTITLDIQNILENIISTYIKSSCNSENIENLYFMMDYILSIFVYSISSKVFENNQINNLSNYFAYILWKQLYRIEGQSYFKNYSIIDIVNHCIALLENIRNYYDTRINNDIINSNDTTEKICSGIQYHLAYFFINRNNPLQYRMIEDHAQSITKHWYYLLYNNKFNIPNNLFVKKSFKNSENSTEYQIVARFNENTENFTNQVLQPNSIDKMWKKTTFSLRSNLNKYTNSDIKQHKRKIKVPFKVKKLKRSKLDANKENNFYNDSYSEESLESDNEDGDWRGSKNTSKSSNLVVNENQKLRRSSRIFNIQQAGSNIPIE
ncbi:uncharacterized protein CMU_006130 [Cryptosporidium muris RN66]|uniref:Uncharacterized protein n=1 Tax=Cryptosporidium muris (strain RN66) TaxID=441375 RepID=B6AHJ5_CRYMR|nr:uncharacterized protein CMU_006130 [Cryptosporidium muris RN66]EEA07690.1 hypothetical protein, conserved [Cryptosporidium muris RN66]|eukprot:XP_002142039.1 hypothetical protein [Cryptosporidium muris RN66]